MEEIGSLVTNAQRGDLDAYAEIVRRFRGMAFACAYAMLGDFHLAEDAAQESFIAAYRSLGDLREPLAFPGWLRRIVFKHCDRLTRRRRIGTTTLDAASGVPSPRPGPVEAAERRETADAVLDAIRRLPDHERMVTTLFYVDGYSHEQIAGFLEVPVTTVNSRLHASRKRLKERMLTMVEQTLKTNAPDERWSRKVIDQLLGRPRPLEMAGHPVRQVWDAIRAALPGYEVVAGEEVAPREQFVELSSDWQAAYKLSEEQGLRTETTMVTLAAMRDRTPPMRLLTAGRVFRPDAEDASHAKVFHQADGLCVEAGADVEALKAVVQQVLTAVLGDCELRWRDEAYPIVQPSFEVEVRSADEWRSVCGCGMLRPEVLREAGHDPEDVSGWAFGIGLDRLAMLKHGIDDIHALWRPPYVTG